MRHLIPMAELERFEPRWAKMSRHGALRFCFSFEQHPTEIVEHKSVSKTRIESIIFGISAWRCQFATKKTTTDATRSSNRNLFDVFCKQKNMVSCVLADKNYANQIAAPSLLIIYSGGLPGSELSNSNSARRAVNSMPKK